jgi:uncharacterized membrane protein YhiD involved in acid resistance
MKGLVYCAIQFLLCLVIIIAGHQLYEYLKKQHTQPVTKNMYANQIEKYKELVEEIQYEHQTQKSMEEDLYTYMMDDLRKDNTQR